MINLCHCQGQYLQTREGWFISWSLLPCTEFVDFLLLGLEPLFWACKFSWFEVCGTQPGQTGVSCGAFLPSVWGCIQDNLLVAEHIPSFTFRYKLYYRWKSIFLDSQYRPFIVLYSFGLYRYCGVLFLIYLFFTDWRSVATLPWASLLVPVFQKHFLTWCLCHILVILRIF